MELKKLVSSMGAFAMAASVFSITVSANTTLYTLQTTEKETRAITLLEPTDFEGASDVAVVAAKADTVDFGTEKLKGKLDGWGYHHAVADNTTSSTDSIKQSDLKVNNRGVQLTGINSNPTKTGGAYLTFTPSNLDNYTEPEKTEEDGTAYTVFYSFTVNVTSTGQYALSTAEGRYVGIGAVGEDSVSSEAKLTTEGEHNVYVTYRNSTNDNRDWLEIYIDGETTASIRYNYHNAEGIRIITPNNGDRSATVQISNFTYGLVNDNEEPEETQTKAYKFVQTLDEAKTKKLVVRITPQNGDAQTQSKRIEDLIVTHLEGEGSLSLAVILTNIPEGAEVNSVVIE